MMDADHDGMGWNEDEEKIRTADGVSAAGRYVMSAGLRGRKQKYRGKGGAGTLRFGAGR